MSGAQWHTHGAVCGWCATPQSAYICRIILRVAQVAHHINKHIENNKINVYQGTLGFSCATCATCYPLISIGKPKIQWHTPPRCATPVCHSKGVCREQEIQAGSSCWPGCSPSGSTRHSACGATRRCRRPR